MAGACIKSIKQDDAKGFKDILVPKSNASWWKSDLALLERWQSQYQPSLRVRQVPMGDEQFKVPEKRSYSPTAEISFSSCADILSVNQDTEAGVQALIQNQHLGSIETKRLWKCHWRQGSWSLVPVTRILSTWTLTSLHSLVCISYNCHVVAFRWSITQSSGALHLKSWQNYDQPSYIWPTVQNFQHISMNF